MTDNTREQIAAQPTVAEVKAEAVREYRAGLPDGTEWLAAYTRETKAAALREAAEVALLDRVGGLRWIADAVNAWLRVRADCIESGEMGSSEPMSSMSETGQMILCESPMDGPATYYIGYTDLVSGYRHAYLRKVQSTRIERTEIALTRSANHPPDPKCPGCQENAR